MTRTSEVSRRTFLNATGGAITPLSAVLLADETPAMPGGLIDCQSHLFCPEQIALMEKRASDPRVFTRDGGRVLQMGDWLRKVPPHYLDVDAKLAAMDGAGITLTALSTNDPGPEWFGADAPAVARMLNDYIASIVSKYPARFIGLCVLPFPDLKAVLTELDRCAKLGMKGVLLYTNLAGRYSDEPEFADFWTRVEELGLPVLLHPAKPLTTEFVKGYEMTSTLGNMFDNTIALTRLIMSGLLDRQPRLRLVCPHLGGTLPYIIGRLEHQVNVLKRGPKNLQRKPLEYLREVWFDIVSPLPDAIRFCHGLLGPERLLFASDHPWVEPRFILDALAAAKLPAADVAGISSANAKRLFAL
jgi:predicted TIM-barrel fold metal-dependent hydrolase